MGKVIKTGTGKRGIKEAREFGNRNNRRFTEKWDRSKRRRFDDSGLSPLQRILYLLAVRA